MYKEYFGLEDMPFSIAPDPRYLYMSEQHREALAHLLYGFNSDGGFVLLTGEVGTGKTTVCRCLLEQVPESSAIAFIINPKLTAEELLATICDEFGITYPEGNRSTKVFIDLINGYLLDAHAQGRKATLIIDEAQNLSTDVLEQLRLLTNLETNQYKLLQIILLGQPELRDKLDRPELRQLSQRVVARYHLGHLSRKDIASYISHRLTIAGVKRRLFTDPAVDTLYKLSGGIPRLINVLCDRALLGAFANGRNEVDRTLLIKAADEVFGRTRSEGQFRKAAVWIAGVIVLAVFGIVLASSYYTRKEPGKPQQAASDVSSVPVIEKPVYDKLQWPADQPLDKSEASAYRVLLDRWGITISDEGTAAPCESLWSSGLACLSDLGHLNTLRQLNTPAVLKLSDESGASFYAAIIKIDDSSVDLSAGGKTLHVPPSEIESRWLGEYTVLWKIPPGYRGEITPGSKGKAVKWLSEQLAGVNKGLSAENSIYTEELVKEVRKFQLASGLKPDGIVGPKTIIHLSNISGNDVPLLNEKEVIR